MQTSIIKITELIIILLNSQVVIKKFQYTKCNKTTVIEESLISEQAPASHKLRALMMLTLTVSILLYSS